MEYQEKLDQEINELKKKYEAVMKRIDVIEKETKETENSIKRMENGFSAMNNNFEELMKKIDNVVEEKESSKMFNNNKEKKSNSMFRGIVTRPMRKLAVYTMSSIFNMADYASEKVSYAREGMEDMVAEAQYKSKKRKSGMMSNMEPSEQC